jgi:DNA invertase Pin-like site-specific DNA recombinase
MQFTGPGPDDPTDRLRKAGCTIIRSEKVSGGSREGRDELTSIMEFVREGDELVASSWIVWAVTPATF